MDFEESFKSYFQEPASSYSIQIDLTKRLQDTQHALQEANSEIDQLTELIMTLYAESRIEQVNTGELISEIPGFPLKMIPLPRNADSISTSEKAGYALFCMKFLGYSTRKVSEEYYKSMEEIHSSRESIKKHAIGGDVPRTGKLKLPELDKAQEIKSDSKSQTSKVNGVKSTRHKDSKQSSAAKIPELQNGDDK